MKNSFLFWRSCALTERLEECTQPPIKWHESNWWMRSWFERKERSSKSARCSWHCLGASFCHWHSWWKDIKKSYGFYRLRHTRWLNDHGQPFTDGSEHIQQCHSTTRMGEWSNIRQHLLRSRTFSPDSDCGCGKCVLAPLQISQNSCLSHPKSWLHNYLSLSIGVHNHAVQ